MAETPADPEAEQGAGKAPEPKGNGDDDSATLGQIFLGLGMLLAIVGAVVWLILGLAPDTVPEKADPGFIDNIFASPIVVAAARIVLLSAAIVLLFAGLYIVVSVLVRMQRGQWLRRAGPFESEIAEIEASLDQADTVYQWWLEALNENEELEGRLEQRDTMIHDLLEERDRLIEELGEPGKT